SVTPAPAAGPPAGAPAKPGVTLDWLAHTAVPLDGLGTVHRGGTTDVPGAQAYFDQGLRPLYAFNHDRAARSFAKAAALDPKCAMCFWGAALALGPNYNAPMMPGRFGMAWSALQGAMANAARGTPVEKALIGALARRYPGPEPVSPAGMKPFSEAYAAA